MQQGAQVGQALVERNLLQLLQTLAYRDQEDIDVSRLGQTCQPTNNMAS